MISSPSKCKSGTRKSTMLGPILGPPHGFPGTFSHFEGMRGSRQPFSGQQSAVLRAAGSGDWGGLPPPTLLGPSLKG
eukprot:4689768-Prorocentrum_lima.AAC.1